MYRWKQQRERAAFLALANGEIFRGWSFGVISPDEEFEAFFGRKADKTRKLYNGMLRCRYYMYFK